MSAIKPKILVIRGGAIGDFILTLPAIAALRKQFPRAHLEVLGYPHIAQLAVAGGLADRVQPIEARGLAGFFASDGELEQDLKDYFSEFDLVISYLYDPDKIFETNLRRCLFGQFIAGPHHPNEAEFVHATQVFLEPLERLAIFDADPVPRLELKEFTRGRADLPVGLDAQQRAPTVALHPGSGSERKNWPEAKWAELLTWAANSTNLSLLLVGGEAEGERLKRLLALIPTARCRVAQNLPLPDLARELQSCTAFVGHDSGISHLAAALGVPALILWADTMEEIWRPQGERVVVLGDLTGVSAISVGKVTDELSKLIGA